MAEEFTNLTAFGVNTKFDPVQEGSKILLVNFLQASTELAGILDDLGTAFSFPKNDMLGNIKRIDEKSQTNPEKYTSINVMLEEDSKAEKSKSLVSAIIWLRRGLDFVRAFLAGISSEFHDGTEREDIRPTVLAAYETTLKPFHGKMVQFLISNVTRLVPYRHNFLKSLCKDSSATFDQVISDLDLFLPNLAANVDLIENLLNEYGVNSNGKTE